MSNLRTLSRRDVYFLVAVSIVALMGWRALRTLVSSALEREYSSHVLLVIPCVIALLLLAPRDSSEQRKGSTSAGILILLIAAAFAGLSNRYGAALGPSNALSLSILSVVTAWIGLTALFYGILRLRKRAFALCFLFLLVPLPDFLVNTITLWLQRGSTAAAHALFIIAGVPVSRDGFVLSLPNIDIEVASECSGIRSTMLLGLTTLLLGHLFLRSAYHQVVMFLAMVAITIVKNALRIFTLAMLAIYVDPSWLQGKLHHQYGGSIFLTVGLAIILGVLKFLRWTENRQRCQAVAAGSDIG